jgi:type I restriction enzyme S subunit
MSDVIQLKEVANMLAGFAIKGSDFGIGESLAVKIKNVLPPKVDVQTLDSFKSDRYGNKIQRYRLNKGDVLISMTGNLGRVATVPEHGRPIYLNQRVAKLLAQSESDTTFLKYQLINPSFAEYCDAFADSATAQPNISVKTMLGYSLVWPKKDIRDAIAEVLSSIDDKIDLLNRQNETLEAMAQTLFRQWFIEEADDSWEEVELINCCEVISSGGTPKTSVSEYYNGSISWFSTKELKDGYLYDAEKHISESALQNSSAKLFPENSVVMAIYAAPTVGRLGILTKPSAFNQAACGIIPDQNKCSSEFIYLQLLNDRYILNSMASGTAQQNLNVGKIKSYRVVLPSKGIMDDFNTHVQPMFKKIRANGASIHTLNQTRDALLPKLMSGEVRVKLD